MRWQFLFLAMFFSSVFAESEHHNIIADEYFKLAQHLEKEGHAQKALTFYNKALDIEPDHFNTNVTLAEHYFQEKNYDNAITCYQRALLIKEDAHLSYNLGQTYAQKEAWADALTYYKKTIALDPQHEQAHLHMGGVYEKLNQHDEAIRTYNEICKENPNCFEAFHHLGNVYKHKEQLELAVEPYQKAYELQPKNIHIIMELANTYNMIDRCKEALQMYEKIVEINPAAISAQYNIGYTLKKLGHLDQALAIYDAVLARKKDYAPARFSRSTIYLANGDLEIGFKEYEWRWKAYGEQAQKYNRPLWEGEDLTGKILLVFAEQGLGDTLQFLRYVKYLKEKNPHIRLMVETQNPLFDLLKGQSYIDELISRSQKPRNCHYHIPLMSLPRVLKTGIDSVPAHVPYIDVDPNRVAYWKEQLKHDRNIKVGLCWQGNARYNTLSLRKAVASKSVPLKLFAPLASIPGISLYSLQQIDGTEQIKDCGFADKLNVFDDSFDKTNGRFIDTAAVMKNLDVVISVDTAVCHLAGALNIPTWIILPHASDWRWLRNRTDSVWYPTVTLFKQPKMGDWESVINNLATALQTVAQKKEFPKKNNKISTFTPPNQFLTERLLNHLD